VLLHIDAGLEGHRVRCPRCQTVFRAEAQTDTEDHRRAAAAARARLDAVCRFDGNWSDPPPDDAPPFRPLSARRAPVIAVANLKGGVGKTTIAANLGAILWSSEPSRRVLVVDLDYQANLTLGCLDRKTIARLRKQGRLVESLFSEEEPDPDALIRAIEPVLDERRQGPQGFIVGCDERLGVCETQAMHRWLANPEAGDVRFRLRRLMQAELVQSEFDYIVLDCPPRLTTACVNALAAADCILIPVLLDERSTEGAPRLLRWLRERRASLFPGLTAIGVLANKTRGTTRESLVHRENDVWSELVPACRDAWPDRLHPFETVVPFFTEPAMARRFPACYREVGLTFTAVAEELRAQLGVDAGVPQ
jgi:cellulose biosynthesis protein BcsQ